MSQSVSVSERVNVSASSLTSHQIDHCSESKGEGPSDMPVMTAPTTTATPMTTRSTASTLSLSGSMASIFENLTMRDGTLVAAKPKADWLRYFEEVTTLPEARSPIEGLAGIEPATPALGRRRSVH